ncbi:MAG: hypothetical protein PHC53_05675 [Patescibacteria group bacterium]|nr:hypothetical protein [Patescibacteria group bacterium]
MEKNLFSNVAVMLVNALLGTLGVPGKAPRGFVANLSERMSFWTRLAEESGVAVELNEGIDLVILIDDTRCGCCDGDEACKSHWPLQVAIGLIRKQGFKGTIAVFPGYCFSSEMCSWTYMNKDGTDKHYRHILPKHNLGFISISFRHMHIENACFLPFCIAHVKALQEELANGNEESLENEDAECLKRYSENAQKLLNG